MNIPDLYLKWSIFCSLFVEMERGVNRHFSDIVFEDLKQDQRAISFSKLLHGDLGGEESIVKRLIDDVMNRYIASHRRETCGAWDASTQSLSASDLGLRTDEFTRRLISAAGEIPAERLEKAHKAMLKLLAPEINSKADARIAINRFSLDRHFPGMLPSGGKAPVKFEPGRHLGQIVIEGVSRDPVAIYTLITRDPSLAGKRMWELNWSETMFWFPSPSRPSRVGGSLNLMEEPQPVEPDSGRFHVTSVLVFDERALEPLDPRGASPSAGTLDASETARFLTNMSRLAKPSKRWPEPPIEILTGKYDVISKGTTNAA